MTTNQQKEKTMERVMIECAGLYDFATQVKLAVKSDKDIDTTALGGTGGDVFYYFDSVDSDGNLESHEVFGKLSLLEKFIDVFSEGGDIDVATLGASGGRSQMIWFEAVGEVGEDLETSPVAAEEASEPVEDVVEEQPTIQAAIDDVQGIVDSAEASQELPEFTGEASAAALELAKINHIDLNLVTGSLPNGKISKPDVVKYMGNK